MAARRDPPHHEGDGRDPVDRELLQQADWLRGLARRLVREADLAEDVAQDTLVVALERGPHRLPPAGEGRTASLRAWLGAVARNVVRRRRRAAATRAHHERVAAETAVDGDVAAADLERLRAQDALTRALLELREPFRSAVVLRYRRNLSYRALARRMGVSEPTARKRVSRGLALLRERLEGAADARDWRSTLAVLAMRPPRAVATGLTIGGITMGAKSIGIAAAALLAVVAGWTLTRGSEELGTPRRDVAAVAPRPDPQAPAQAPAPAALPAARAEAAPPEVVSRVSAGPVDEARLLRGRVVDGGGAPVEGARVEARRDELRGFSTLDLAHDDRGRRVAETTTDGEGRFGVEVLVGQPFDLEASAPGSAPALTTGRYAGEEVELVLRPGARLVALLERPDGSAVGGALVEVLRPEAPFLELTRGRTDERGRFEADDLPAGTLQLRVLPPRDAMVFRHHVILEPGRTTVETLTVQPGLTVVGRVVDARTLAPIEGAEVGVAWTLRKAVRTDAAGAFELLGFPAEGVYEVHARAHGQGRAKAPLPDSVDGVCRVEIRLPPAVSATGRLVDEDGAPIAGAYVAAVASPDWRAGRTAADGRFRIEDLAADTAYALFAAAEGFGTCAFEFPRPLRDSGRYELGDVRLRLGGRLHARVVDPSGEPLPGVAVTLAAEYADRYALSGDLDSTANGERLDLREARTDSRGRVAFGDLSAGRYRLVAEGDGSRSRSGPHVVERGQVVEDVEVVLDEGLELAGIVVDEAGEPVPGTLVWFDADSSARTAQATTDAAGRFRVAGLDADTVRIEAWPTEIFGGERGAGVLPTVLEGVDPFAGELRIVLPAASPTKGVVVDARGDPVAQALVVAFAAEGGELARDFADGTGAFVLQLEPGATASVSAKRPPTDRPFFHASAAFGTGSTTLRGVRAGATDLRLELPPAADD